MNSPREKVMIATAFFIAAALLLIFLEDRRKVQNSLLESYLASSNEVAKQIAIPTKIHDITSIDRAVSSSFFAKYSREVWVRHESGKFLFPLDREDQNCGSTETIETPILYNDHKVGTIFFCLKDSALAASSFPWLLFWVTILGAVLFAASLFVIFRRHNEPMVKFIQLLDSIDHTNPSFPSYPDVKSQTSIDGLYPKISKLLEKVRISAKEREDSQRNAAIARTVQMMAHDVRKPFSIVKSGIQVLEAAHSINQIYELLPQLRQALDQSLSGVNNMIEDIMEVGKETLVEVKPSSPKRRIQSTLEEIGQIYSNHSINLSFEWHHRHKILVDPQKIKRVFSNILANACQAIRSGGEIWIKTQQHGREITFTLGNSGSSIAQEDCDKLFEAFFTKGKKGGTGLGLAIAKKIVEAHGGKIWVESDTQKQTVEFFITLPCADTLDDSQDLSFPSQLAEYRMLRVPQAEPPAWPKAEFVERIQGHVQKHGQKLQIAILDDESLYRKAVVKLAASEPLTELFEFHEFSCPRDFLDADLSAFDFLISDVDLQDQDLNGYDVVSRIRDELGLSLPICIHSNKTLAQDFKRAVEVGASAVLPKPLTLDHLLKFIVDGLAELSDPKTAAAQAHTTPKPKVAFIDDDSFLRKIVPTTMADADVQTFASPEEFLKSSSPKDIAKFQAIITDQYFDQKSDTLGLQLAELLRDFHGYPGLLILFSDGSFSPKDLHPVNLHLMKSEIPTWNELCQKLDSELIKKVLEKTQNP